MANMETKIRLHMAPLLQDEPRKHRIGWKRRKRARPIEILAAASTVFSLNGYSATRMADIATLAGITKGTIYLYFTSKEELFNAIKVRKYVESDFLDQSKHA
jgi:DNA-binding transcriptional regulator YbjK